LTLVADVRDTGPGETLVIRTHGVPASVLREAETHNVPLVDATCTFVRRAHEHARELSSAGRTLCIVGDREHPEVLGIIGSVDAESHVIETPDQAEALAPTDKVGVVAQTTQTTENYCRIVGILAGKCQSLVAYNTLCNATSERQAAALRLAREADVVLVVGGRHSANTGRLAAICAATGTPTHHIETSQELRAEWLADAQLIGVTAGASTPRDHIEAVERRALELASQGR